MQFILPKVEPHFTLQESFKWLYTNHSITVKNTTLIKMIIEVIKHSNNFLIFFS